MKKLVALAAISLMLLGCSNVEEGDNWKYVTIDGMDCILYNRGSLDCDWSMKE